MNEELFNRKFKKKDEDDDGLGIGDIDIDIDNDNKGSNQSEDEHHDDDDMHENADGDETTGNSLKDKIKRLSKGGSGLMDGTPENKKLLVRETLILIVTVIVAFGLTAIGISTISYKMNGDSAEPTPDNQSLVPQNSSVATNTNPDSGGKVVYQLGDDGNLTIQETDVSGSTTTKNEQFAKQPKVDTPNDVFAISTMSDVEAKMNDNASAKKQDNNQQNGLFINLEDDAKDVVVEGKGNSANVGVNMNVSLNPPIKNASSSPINDVPLVNTVQPAKKGGDDIVIPGLKDGVIRKSPSNGSASTLVNESHQAPAPTADGNQNANNANGMNDNSASNSGAVAQQNNVAIQNGVPTQNVQPPPVPIAPKASAKTQVSAPVQPPAKKTAEIDSNGKFILQFISARSESEANAVLNKIKPYVPDAKIVKADLGDKGVYYRVRGFASTTREDAQAHLGELKAKGFTPVIAVND